MPIIAVANTLAAECLKNGGKERYVQVEAHLHAAPAENW